MTPVALALAARIALCSAAIAAFASHARAAPELELRWPEHASCPTESAVARHVEEQLGRNLADVERALVAIAHIRESDRGYTLVLETAYGSERGERTFHAPTCAEVSDAAVLLLALSLEERRDEGAPASERGEQTASSAESDGGEHGIAVGGLAAALADYGALPSLAIAPELGALLAFGRSRVELTGFFFAAQDSEPGESGRVRVSLGGGRARYCRILAGARVELSACAGAELGVMTGRGFELAPAQRRRFLWRAATLAVQLAVRVAGPFALFVEPGLAIPLGRGRFVADLPDGTSANLHTPAVVSARGALGFHLTFR